MARAFLEYLKKKIEEDPSLLRAGKEGARLRFFDHFSPKNEDLGKEAILFLKQADFLYKNHAFETPYTKKNVDFTHHLFTQINKDLEEYPEWNDFWTALQTQLSLSEGEVALLKIQFVSAYRFKIITLFNATLQQMYPDDKLKIVSREGNFLQTINTLIKNEAQKRYLTSDELFAAIFQDISRDLRISLGTEENFKTFYTPKNAKFIQDLGIEGFKIIFLHFNNDERTLTHKSPPFAGTAQIRDFMKLVHSTVKESASLTETLQGDPEAVFFLQKAYKTLKKDNNQEDKPLLKFFDNLIQSSQANPKNLRSDLKKIEKKLQGDLKTKVKGFIKTIKSTAGFPDVPYSVMSQILKSLSELKIQATLANFAQQNDNVQNLIKICDIYLGNKKSSPPSSAILRTSSPPVYTPGAAAAAASPMQISREASPILAPPDPKTKLVLNLETRAMEIQAVQTKSERELTKNEKVISALILESSKKISELHDSQEIYKTITELKLAIIKVRAESASADNNLENINEEIDSLYALFQSERMEPPRLI